MTDFDYDVLQKKRIASGAYHRKGGSKSKKCTLPSDHLTEAQKRKLNGPMTTVQMGQPMAWLDYKGLSDELKKKYLMDVLNSYKPSARMLSEMFNISRRTLINEMRRLGLPIGKRGYYRPTEAQNAMWEAFCNGVVGGGNSIVSGTSEQIEAQDEQIESEPVQTETQTWDLDSPDHVNAHRVAPDEEPQVTCYDAEAEAEARAKERLESIKAQGVSQHSADKNVAENERNEPEYGEEVEEEPSPMRSLSAEYEGDAERIAELMGRLAQMFYGDEVKVKLTIEVCG